LTTHGFPGHTLNPPPPQQQQQKHGNWSQASPLQNIGLWD
jgi:hypothetical protein